MHHSIHKISRNTIICRSSVCCIIHDRFTTTHSGVNLKKEAQMMLTNPRDASRGQSRSPNIAPFDMLVIFFLLLCYSKFVLKMRVFQIFDFKNCRDFEIRVRGHSKSLKVVPFDRLGIVSYWTSNYTVTLKPCGGAGGAEGAVAPPLADKGANGIKCPPFRTLAE